MISWTRSPSTGAGSTRELTSTRWWWAWAWDLSVTSTRTWTPRTGRLELWWQSRWTRTRENVSNFTFLFKYFCTNENVSVFRDKEVKCSALFSFWLFSLLRLKERLQYELVEKYFSISSSPYYSSWPVSHVLQWWWGSLDSGRELHQSVRLQWLEQCWPCVKSQHHTGLHPGHDHYQPVTTHALPSQALVQM